MKKQETLKHREVYVYDKDVGFELYNPLSYSFKGYTIDKLYELVEHQKKKLDELEFALEDLKEYLELQGINTLNKTLYELSTGIRKYELSSNPQELTFIQRDKDGYVTSVTRLASKDVFTRDSINTPPDINKGIYKLVRGEFIKDEEKEAELWRLYG
jgi:hypothetical protein